MIYATSSLGKLLLSNRFDRVFYLVYSEGMIIRRDSMEVDCTISIALLRTSIYHGKERISIYLFHSQKKSKILALDENLLSRTTE